MIRMSVSVKLDKAWIEKYAKKYDDKAKTKLKELYDLLKVSKTEIFSVDASNVSEPFFEGVGN